jgi:hypothetical protein
MATIIPFPASRISRRPRVRPGEDFISKVRDAIHILEENCERRGRMRIEEVWLCEDLAGAIGEYQSIRPALGA